MARDGGLKFPSHGFLDGVDPLVGELPDFTALVANMVIMVLVCQRLFVKRHFVLELVLHRKSAFYQKIQCIVDRGAADGVAFVAHEEKKSLHVNVLVLGQGVEFIDDRKPLRCLPTPLSHEEVFEYLLGLFYY